MISALVNLGYQRPMAERALAKLGNVSAESFDTLFRKAMADVLPLEVLRQPKAGFAAPTDYWLANELKEMTDDLLSASHVASRGLFRPAAVRQMIEQHRSGREDWSMQIWQFLTLELWMQNFLDRPSGRTADQPMQAAIA